MRIGFTHRNNSSSAERWKKMGLSERNNKDKVEPQSAVNIKATIQHLNDTSV